MRIGIDLRPLQAGNLMRGIGIYVENLLPALSTITEGIEFILFITGPFVRPDWSKTLGPTFQWIELPPVRAGRLSSLLNSQITLPNFASRHQLDLLHCICVPTNGSQPSIPFWQTVPTVVTVHDLSPLALTQNLLPYFYQRFFYRFQLLACRKAAHLLTDSESSRQDILKYLDLAPAKVTTAHLATPAFNNHVSGDPLLNLPVPFLLHVGGSDYQKNQKTVLKAFANLCKDPEFRHNLALVGANHLEDEVATKIEPATSGRIYRFSGITRLQLQRLYRECDVFLFPSLYEGFGFPVLEAMSCGAPVVASQIPSIREVAADAAILLDPIDASAIASAIRNVIQDDSLRQKLIEAGYRRAETFSWIRTAQTTLSVYKQIYHNT